AVDRRAQVERDRIGWRGRLGHLDALGRAGDEHLVAVGAVADAEHAIPELRATGGIAVPGLARATRLDDADQRVVLAERPADARIGRADDLVVVEVEARAGAPLHDRVRFLDPHRQRDAVDRVLRRVRLGLRLRRGVRARLVGRLLGFGRRIAA